MLTPEKAKEVLRGADLICDEASVQAALERLAAEISQRLGHCNPLLLSVMSGAVVFSGQLLTRLNFPLDFDYLHVTRYGDRTVGGGLQWKVFPQTPMTGRVVLVLDDVFDEGHTMAAIRQRVMEAGAAQFFCAVFADKKIGRTKPLQADFVGMELPDRYIFGYGLDVKGAWRNLPAIYALKPGQAL
ncbi:MAG: hypoxanthine-guanine phosphoribosyltransferase [Betaproteobacteria bacterium]